MSNTYSNLFAGLGSYGTGFSDLFGPAPRSTVANTETDFSTGAILQALGIILFVAFLILIVIHYAYTPIFTFAPGDQGVIPLGLGTSDSQLIWTDEPPPASVKSKFNNLLPCGFTLQMDLFIDRNLQLSNTERVALYRATKPVVPDTTGAKTLFQNYPDTNLVVYLQKDTNDLVVSAITQNGEQIFIESAPTILNAPLKQPFRLNIVFLPNLLEVYINGRFRGSRVLKNMPRNSTAQFYAPPDAFQSTVKVMNLCYWNRPLLAREIAKTPPPLPSSDVFRPSDEAQCAT